ncbi:MAG: site-2 protease family protein [Terracidiphilus sp.]
MATLRKTLLWVYALIAFTSIRIGLWPILSTMCRHSGFMPLRSFFVSILLTGLGVVSAMAWWTNFRAKSSARAWGLAASLTNTLVALLPSVLARRPVFGALGIVLAIGVAGLVAYLRPFRAPERVADAREDQSMPGDWTCNFVNKLAAAIIFGLSLGAYLWWTQWTGARGITGLRHSWYGIFMNLVVVLAITTIHELGHVGAGLACGMKLRAFVSGPLQWRVREGKWEFKFNPRGFILPEGATGVVPASGKILRWHYVSMMSAGSLINLLTGAVALAIAVIAPSHAPVQAGGVLALFGAWSLALAAGNLLPFRTRNCYSDGASLIQLLAGGPWADFHLAIAAIGSSQVSALRPRDYDIRAIEQAAGSITGGREGLLLRLFAFNHYLDRGKTREAERAIADAESVYHQSASDVPAELITAFVFANAYVRRDADAAREWFERMQMKNPTRFNLDYWRAHSALHWIEGDLKKANDAWEKSNALAKQLPKAGAYEFDRYCSSLLRRALDESPMAA